MAVSPKEILPLLDRGVKVFGSSSIGALRAVELNIYGMVGVGLIFEQYLKGELDADDEVAITYDPETSRTTSEALVNIRFAIREAVNERVLEEASGAHILAAMKAMYFPFRSFNEVASMNPTLGNFISLRKPNQKRDDALLLLKTIKMVGQ